VVGGFAARPGIEYSALWFNEAGLRRALPFKGKLALGGSISLSASEAFSQKNLNRDRAGQIEAMLKTTRAHVAAGIPVARIIVMAAFGCNYQGDIAPADVVRSIEDGLRIADETEVRARSVSLADTMGWATPARVQQIVGKVRGCWPELEVGLHLHDTRGLGIANAYAGLQLGVRRFDAAVAGLGGCPFAGQPGAPGNIATEELALLCEEMGIATGIDIDALIDVARRAERVVGRQLPSAALRSGTLTAFRRRAAA
jgi:hydroxymethylglutaryl-CoA lyase